MTKRIMGVLAFFVVLCLYLTVVAALARVLPLIFLSGLLAWLIIRRPVTHPDRIDSDIQVFADRVRGCTKKLVDALVWPLTKVI